MRHILIFLVRLYQITISPVIGGRARCRFHPRCSDYALEVIETHGAIKGSWLTLKRLVRCNPFCKAGLDLPPLPRHTGLDPVSSKNTEIFQSRRDCALNAAPTQVSAQYLRRRPARRSGLPSIIPASTLSQISSDIIRDGIEKVVVGAVIIFEGGRALMVRRSAGDFLGGLVELPSGTVDSGESLIDALIREVREETGLTLTSIDKFVGTFDYTSGSGKRARQVNFRASAASENVILSPEHSAFYILPIEELAKLENVSEKSLSIIKSALA